MSVVSPYTSWRTLIVTNDQGLRKQLNALLLNSFAAVEFAFSNAEGRQRIAHVYGPTIKLIMIDINLINQKSALAWNASLRRLLRSPLVNLLTRGEATLERLEWASPIVYVGLLDVTLPPKDFISELLISTGHSGKSAPKVAPPVNPHLARAKRLIPGAKAPLADPAAALEDAAQGEPETEESLIERYKIPPCPVILEEISRELSSGDIDFQRIAELIEQDKVLMENLLRIANSAFYAPTKRITTANAAIQTIGMRDVVIIFQNNIFAQAFNASAVNRNDFESTLWQYFFTSGLTAKNLAARINALEGTTVIAEDRAFLLGLMHNVGMLLLARASLVYRQYLLKQNLLNDITGTAQCLWEKQQYGIDHTKISNIVAKYWSMPHEHCEAILYQPLRDKVTHSDRIIRILEAILSLSDFLATPLVFPTTLIPDKDALLNKLLEAAGLTMADWEGLLTAMLGELGKHGVKPTGVRV
jgi:HD-like signal output (HDOD) protein